MGLPPEPQCLLLEGSGVLVTIDADWHNTDVAAFQSDTGNCLWARGYVGGIYEAAIAGDRLLLAGWGGALVIQLRSGTPEPGLFLGERVWIDHLRKVDDKIVVAYGDAPAGVEVLQASDLTPVWKRELADAYLWKTETVADRVTLFLGDWTRYSEMPRPGGIHYQRWELLLADGREVSRKPIAEFDASAPEPAPEGLTGPVGAFMRDELRREAQAGTPFGLLERTLLLRTEQAVSARDLATGRLRWKQEVPYLATALVEGGGIYVARQEHPQEKWDRERQTKRVTRLEPATGQVRWTAPVPQTWRVSLTVPPGTGGNGGTAMPADTSGPSMASRARVILLSTLGLGAIVCLVWLARRRLPTRKRPG